ncbi:hypothetical protein [Vibrio mangrovi]|uniref:Uncharacterized protein n=1 Tax=Vibrio mangrovi TaxID=474394 RepID=A0A1Y6IZB1_9VIBR|nr:hypothetical protein [Vibrio mangrovi]MDW6005054.1 hypothetical protein [Vibrio mangrovi]SMS01822.1 hypothetical protein VIM7927_03130 [Vibrio mangrovi]
MAENQKSASVMDERVTAPVSGFGLSYAITSILSALLVVLKESSEMIHDGMVASTGHHWVTHGLLNLIIFLILGFIFNNWGTPMPVRKLLVLMVGSTVLSGLIIAGYFI